MFNTFIKRALIGLCFGLLFFFSISAQESVGLNYGQFNGLNSARINPSFLQKSKTKWELQLIGGHSFIETNYAFINSSNLINSLSNTDLINVPDIAYDDNLDAQPLDVIFHSDAPQTRIDIKNELLGPGAMYRINYRTIAGLSVKGRSFLTASNIPSSLNYYNIIELPVDSLFELGEFQVNGMGWLEYSGHFAYQHSEKLDIGASLKYLKGFDGGSFDNNVNIDYIERADTLTSLDKGQARLAFTQIDDDVINPNGFGFGLDLGINLKNEDGSSLGVSLLDLGYLKFSGKDYLIDYDAGQFIVYSDYDFVSNIDQQIGQMIIDGFQIDSSQNFTLALPTALSIQYQKPINDKLSIQAHWVQNVKISDQQLRRSNSLAIAGVYDTKRISAFLPVSLYNYSDLRIGAAVRLAFLTIGSDNIFSLFGSQDFNGSDIYVNLKVYPFKIKNNTGSSADIPCYGF